MSWVCAFRKRRARLSRVFKRGALPDVSIRLGHPLGRVLRQGVLVGVWVGILVGWLLVYWGVRDAVDKALFVGGLASLVWWVLPVCMVGRGFSSTRRWVACATLAFFLVTLLEYGFVVQRYLVWSVFTIGLFGIMHGLSKPWNLKYGGRTRVANSSLPFSLGWVS